VGWAYSREVFARDFKGNNVRKESIATCENYQAINPLKITLNKIFGIAYQMGWKYTAYRGYHEVIKRSGLLKKQFPTTPDFKVFITLEQWRKDTPLFFFKDREDLPEILKAFTTPEKNVERIINGKIQFFSSQWIQLESTYDWVTHPITGYKFRTDQHWTELDEFSKKAGDIKYIWEKSRFSWLYSIIRFDKQQGCDHSSFVFSEIESWINANPINQGPNYICSQEISLRVLNWTFAIYYYRNSEFLTPALFEKIMHSIYWQIDHVYRNINFSRIAVRNNHAITETLMLYLSGLLFPFFPNNDTWQAKGKKCFEEEIAYQVYTDGTHLQFSMNYHRVVIQLLTWAIALSRIHNQHLSEIIYEKAYKSLNFLLQCQELSNGFLPNYGANDGALFFPITSCDYRDFRPQLNALHFLLTGKVLYDHGPWSEEAEWYSISSYALKKFPALFQKQGIQRFDDGGYYLYRETDSLTFIRCGNHKNRPSQADNLHMDLWHKGENLLMDAGSYLYNATKEDWRYFSGTTGHNTVTLSGEDQMLHGGRFIWYNWTQVKSITISLEGSKFIFQGTIKAFSHLKKGILHTRYIEKQSDEPIWMVRDSIERKPGDVLVAQRWHTLLPEKIKISADQTPVSWNTDGWVSSFYGTRIPGFQAVIETRDEKISAKIEIL